MEECSIPARFGFSSFDMVFFLKYFSIFVQWLGKQTFRNPAEEQVWKR